jgi:hypothetical protein
MMQDGRWIDSAGDYEAPPDLPAAGLLVIRTWHDPWHPQGFLARITYGQSPGSNQTTLATADPAEVLELVKRWLAAQPGVSHRN